MSLPRPGRTVTVSEWQNEWAEGVRLSPEDRLLAARLSSSQRVFVRELDSGVEIETRSWVGVAQFSGFTLRVIPKLADGYSRLVQMLALTGRFSARWRAAALRSFGAHRGADLLDLLVSSLAAECERILVRGMLHDYVEREGALAAVRGRILADRQWRKRCGQFDRVECRFDEHETDIDENRVIAHTLAACRPTVRNPSVLSRLLLVHEQFGPASETRGFDAAAVRRGLRYHRLNEHYRDAHELCWLLLGGMGVTDLLATGLPTGDAFFIDMNAVFEGFVHRLLQDAAGRTFTVAYQARNRSILWNAIEAKSCGTVIPDFLLGTPAGPVVADAKYKSDIPAAGSDVYQVFLYAHTFSSWMPTPAAILIYPSTSGSIQQTVLEVRDVGRVVKSRVHMLGIPLARAVDELIDQTRPAAICGALRETVGAAAALSVVSKH